MIDCAFPGGNIIVERIEGDTIYLHQDLRDTEGDWFYWAFRLRGAAGRRLRFIFTRSRALGVRGKWNGDAASYCTGPGLSVCSGPWPDAPAPPPAA